MTKRPWPRRAEPSGSADPQPHHPPLQGSDLARVCRLLSRRDPRLGALIRRVGPCGLIRARRHDPFGDLVRVILSQQLSSKAARTIFERVETLAGGPGVLRPDAVLALTPETLRGAGVSRPKASYLHDLAARVSDGRLDLASLESRPDDEVVDAITSVKGLGQWSADMFLIFRLHRPDVFPVGDLGIVRGVQRLHGLRRPPPERTMLKLAEPWRPYRSVAAWYLWRLSD